MPASIPNWNDLTEHQRGHILKAAEAYCEPSGAGQAEIAFEMFYATMEAIAAPEDEVAKLRPIRDKLGEHGELYMRLNGFYRIGPDGPVEPEFGYRNFRDNGFQQPILKEAAGALAALAAQIST
ncbi:hypothetical protein [Phaeobacter inhibens]|uniref:hypothetical protein n=1 Tax=Phaeobacter inhibens TaxID=221822 RepID=UPI0021A36777|nr:hypothetical protein [Phaeobacter inhibens]UWR57208.1 hypothetical protein K4F89_01770 [Phaeobacter inhibens]